MTSPLYVLTRKDTPFEWSSDCEAAFTQLKTLTPDPVTSVGVVSFQRRIPARKDASGIGLGAILSQRQPDEMIRPITFASCTLQSHEKNYGINELEALGVVWTVKHYRHYLYGHQCTVFTDHEALKSTLNTP